MGGIRRPRDVAIVTEAGANGTALRSDTTSTHDTLHRWRMMRRAVCVGIEQ